MNRPVDNPQRIVIPSKETEYIKTILVVSGFDMLFLTKKQTDHLRKELNKEAENEK